MFCLNISLGYTIGLGAGTTQWYNNLLLIAIRWLNTNFAEVISLGNLIVLGTQIATTASRFNQFKSFARSFNASIFCIYESG